ncbi:MAG: STAS domain-containing protein [Candidatus Zixiibacteriota bacterium]
MFDISKTGKDTLRLAGRFDASQAEKAEAALNEIDGACVIDCEELDYISSAGLGALVATFHRLAASGERITLANVNAHIRDIFRISGLDQLFDFT